MHYLKFSLFHVLTGIAIVAMFLGQHWIIYGYIAITLFIVGGDTLFGDDKSTPKYKYKWILDMQLYIALPLLVALLFISLWHVSSVDPFGFGQWVKETFKFDLFEARIWTPRVKQAC